MNLIEVVEGVLSHVQHYLRHISPNRYSQPLELLSQASIGQHTRHILEFFDCLLCQYENGTINYDLRQRDHRIESDPEYALELIHSTLARLPHTDPGLPLSLAHNYDPFTEEVIQVETTLARELVYNVEHTIHHLAMIKIGLREAAPEITLPPAFGVAPSTLKYHLAD